MSSAYGSTKSRRCSQCSDDVTTLPCLHAVCLRCTRGNDNGSSSRASSAPGDEEYCPVCCCSFHPDNIGVEQQTVDAEQAAVEQSGGGHGFYDIDWTAAGDDVIRDPLGHLVPTVAARCAECGHREHSCTCSIGSLSPVHNDVEHSATERRDQNMAKELALDVADVNTKPGGNASQPASTRSKYQQVMQSQVPLDGHEQRHQQQPDSGDFRREDYEVTVRQRELDLANMKTTMSRQTDDYAATVRQIEERLADAERAVTLQHEQYDAKIKQLETEQRTTNEQLGRQSEEYHAKLAELQTQRRLAEEQLKKQQQENEEHVKRLHDERRSAEIQLAKETEEYAATVKRLERELVEVGNILSKQLEDNDAAVEQMAKEKRSNEELVARQAAEYEAKVKQLEKRLREAERMLEKKSKENDDTVTHFERQKLIVDDLLTKRNEDDAEKLKRVTRAQKASVRKARMRMMPTDSDTADAARIELLQSFTAVKTVYGFAILDKRLYVGHYDTNTVATYDTVHYELVRRLTIPGLGGVIDMTPCPQHGCIYIADYLNSSVCKFVAETKTATHWPVNTWPQGVSVTAAFNVLVACYHVNALKEFTPDGTLVREIGLQSDIVRPMHAVELSADQFVVCHGLHTDPLSRVCLVDAVSGSVKQSYGGKPGSYRGRVDWPISLALFGDCVIVADFNNRRLLMLNATLSCVLRVVNDVPGPWRLHFDVGTSRLYVACSGGLVNVYSVVRTEPLPPAQE